MRRLLEKFALDLILWSLSALVAFWLRLEYPPRYSVALIAYVLVGLPVKATLIWAFGLHRQSWKKVGVRDLYILAQAVGLGMIILSAISFFIYPQKSIPRSIPLIEGGVALLLLGGIRLAARLLNERGLAGKTSGNQARRVLIIGAGEAGTMLVREMLRHPEAGLVPVGFLDDDPSKKHRRFVGIPVLGDIEALPRSVRKVGADEVLIAIPSAPGHVVRKVVELARNAGVSHRIVPGIYEILSGKVSISQIREVDVVDLLRRDPVRLNIEEIAGYLENRVVLITGAGGSIGSEIVRQVARFRPERVILLGRGENSLYQIEREIERTWPELAWRTVVGDVRDKAKMDYVFSLFRPRVVFHAAAHKHVPMMELNPDEAVFNNVGGTKNLVELALAYDVERFVNISTDKAVNPTSVMGASKRVAEYLVQWAAQRAKEGQVFVSVRFGNVLGSRGSVIPLFKEQIRLGGPITVTDPRMTRYFMTIPEAAQLVLQAGGLGNNGSVYVLDMGKPVKIEDLARGLIRLSGLEPDTDIRIVYTGIRPGEKLYEELLTAEEGTEMSEHEQIFIAKTDALDEDTLDSLLSELFRAASLRDPKAIRAAFSRLIPTYTPASQG